MKIKFLNILIIFQLIASISVAKVDEKTFKHLISLINEGDYEDALTAGQKVYKKYKYKDAAMFCIAASLMSQASYHWYQFKQSDLYFDIAYKSFTTSSNIMQSDQDKFVSGLYLLEVAIQRNDWVAASEVIKVFPAASDSISAIHQCKYHQSKAKILNAYGNYELALAELEKAYTLDKIIILQCGRKVSNEMRFEYYVQKANVLLGYGFNAELDTTFGKIATLIKEKKLKGSEYNFAKKIIEANIAFNNRNYNKASTDYLEAYNSLDVNTEQYQKYDALKMAAISSIKAGSVAEYQKLFRRSDMLAFKKPMKSQAFRPGVVQLKLIQLLESGQYNTALARAAEVNKIYSFLPKSNPYFVEFLELKATAAEAEGDIKTYGSVLDTLEIIAERYFGKKSMKYANVQLQKADFQVKYGGNLIQSLALYKEYYDGYVSKKLYNHSPIRVPILESYTKLYQYLDKSDSAIAKNLIAKEIASKVWGKNSVVHNYFNTIHAYEKFNLGSYAESIKLLNECYDITKKQQNNESGYLAKACFLQSNMFEWLGEYKYSNELVAKANELGLYKEEKKFYEMFETSEQMARAFAAKNNFFKAEKYLKTSLEIKTKKAGAESFTLIDPLLEIINLKILKGDLREAEKYLKQAEVLLKMYFDSNSGQYARFDFLSSQYYASVSDNKKALDLLLKSIDKVIKIYGKNHVRLATLYSNLAKLYLADDKLILTQETFQNALNIVANGLGKQSPAYAMLLVQQTELLIKSQKYSKVVENLDQAESFWQAKLGIINVHIAEINFIRGEVFYLQKNYNEADKNYKKAAKLYGDIFNKKHPDFLKSNVCIAKVAFMKKDYSAGTTLMESVLDERINYTVQNFSIMSFNQKSNFWAGFREEFEFYYALVYKIIATPSGAKKAADVYNYAIRTKGLLMTSDAKVRKQVFESGDSVLVATFNQWLSQKEYFALTSFYSGAQLAEENISLDKIASNIEVLEKKINAKASINLSSNAKPLSWTDVKKSIDNSSAAVEILRFRKFNHTFTDSVVYLSLIIDAKSKEAPHFVLLENGKDMEGRQLSYYRNTSINKLDNEYAYDAYWKPIKSRISNGTTIFFSGEGVYTQINLEMMFNSDQSKYAIDENEFVFVTNTKDIIQEEKIRKPKNNMQEKFYLYGNPKFYTTKSIKKTEALQNLDGAEKEIDDIAATLKKYGRKSEFIIGAGITEDTIKSLENPSVLHISTHGFFVERKSGGNELLNNPMLNSGLLLSGSGNILDSDEYINQKPGVLTASEVMDLNFSKTNLVVLSACETGRGQVQVGEGVYGLQRAFLVAGAKAIVLSLFKVDDTATRLLMAKFYEKFLNNNGDYRAAFRDAKKELKNSEIFKAPIYWGAFIMIEGHPEKPSIN